MVTITFLGAFHLTLDGTPQPPTPKSARLLLAYLALARNRALNRRVVSDALFPDLSDPLGALRTALKLLRRALGPASNLLRSDDETIGLFDAQTALHCDLDRVAAARAPGAGRAALTAALPHLGAIFLPTIDDCLWVAGQRAALAQTFEVIAARAFALFEREQDWDAANELAERCIASDVHGTGAFGALMKAEHAQRGAAGLAYAYERFLTWAEARDLTMPKDIAALHDRLLRTPAPPTIAGGAGAQPAPREAQRTLPSPPTPFLGRHKDLADLLALLADPACRLLTLLGMGGCGKTRLAIEAAARCHSLPRFSDGAYFASLESVDDEAGLYTAIAHALGFGFREQSAPRAQLTDYLRGRAILLVLDACERMLSADPALADALNALLNDAPGLCLLSTSRERFHLQREYVFEIDGLEVPPDADGDLEQYDAVQLFVQRARQFNVRFSLAQDRAGVVRILHLTSGSPLAIELAAARTRGLPPMTIARQIEHGLDLLTSELRDVPPRHRSMQAVIDYSYALLDSEAKRAFAALSLCAGSFSLDTALQVTGAHVAVLDKLVNASMLRREPGGRYAMHDLLRQYGESCAHTLEVAHDASHRLARHCLVMARTSWPANPALDWPLLAAGLDAARRTPDLELVTALGMALGMRWHEHGRYADAAQRLPSVALSAQAAGRLHDAARLWLLAACASTELADYPQALRHIDTAVACANGEAEITAATHCARARIAVELGDTREAEALIDAVLSDRDHHTEEDVAQLTLLAARLYYRAGDDARVLALAGEAQRLLRAHAPRSRAHIETLCLRAVTLAYRGGIAEANALCAEAIAIARETGLPQHLAETLHARAQVEKFARDYDAARQTSAEAARQFRELGDRQNAAHALLQHSQMCLETGRPDTALASAQQARQLYADIQAHWCLPEAMLTLGDAYQALQRSDLAQSAWIDALRMAAQDHPAVNDLRRRLNLELPSVI